MEIAIGITYWSQSTDRVQPQRVIFLVATRALRAAICVDRGREPAPDRVPGSSIRTYGSTGSHRLPAGALDAAVVESLGWALAGRRQRVEDALLRGGPQRAKC